jgi:hypothetical protein
MSVKSPHRELYSSAVEMEVGTRFRGALPKYGAFLRSIGALSEDMYKALSDNKEVTGTKLLAIVNGHQEAINLSYINLQRAFEDLAQLGFSGRFK